MIDKHENFALISLKEKSLDTRISSELKSEFVMLNNEGIHSIVLDLSDTQYADSSGLSALLVANRLCNNADGIFVVCGICPQVKKLLDISQLSAVLNIQPNKEEAIQLVKGIEASSESSVVNGIGYGAAAASTLSSADEEIHDDEDWDDEDWDDEDWDDEDLSEEDDEEDDLEDWDDEDWDEPVDEPFEDDEEA